ncbi:IS481 family transposase [Streptomyces sp. ODS28]|uniref:IS481 family transposase n=1 Tax=Streptomyces sp. ODS28 TaxID=3136688 RepID=UPI0031F185D0
MEPRELQEYRYRAVREVLEGSPIGEVAARFGTSRQSLHTWRTRFEREGMTGLVDRSRRPRSSPGRTFADIEALVCQLRRRHPRWGARRLRYEMGRRGAAPLPSRATVHRILVRNGLVTAEQQEHKRQFKRWQRAGPMSLWQLDLVGGVFLADGRECKLVTGIDDHSRFVVVSALVAVPSGRAVCEAFVAAMRRYGVPSEVLTDNGKQFTGRYVKPLPVEVMFERICRQNGINARLTKPRSPTTTGKIERFHKTLRQEFLDAAAPFVSFDGAQQAIDEWVSCYNHRRPHQALEMARPIERFRPNTPSPDIDIPSADSAEEYPTASDDGALEVIEPPPAPPAAAGAIEFELLVPPSGSTTLASDGQHVWIGREWAGRIVTVWADQRSIHVSLDGRHLRTVASRLSTDHLHQLAMRGARPAAAPSAPPALPRRGGLQLAPTSEPVEIERNVRRDGCVLVAGRPYLLGPNHSGERITLRLDGYLIHAISQGVLAATWPCPVTSDRLHTLRGAHTVSTPLPAGSIRVQRRVGTTGRIMVGGQRLKLGRANAGKIVTVVIEDTYFRILHGEEELATKPRRDTAPITHLHVHARHSNPAKPSSDS